VPDSHVLIKIKGLPRSWATVFASSNSEMGKLFPGIRAPIVTMAEAINVNAKTICFFITGVKLTDERRPCKGRVEKRSFSNLLHLRDLDL